MSQSEFAKRLGIGAIGHENRTYFKANKSCDELIDENSEFTERLEIGAFWHENRTYFKAYKSCDELIDENTEFTRRLGFKVTEKEKKLSITYSFVKCIRIQQVHVWSLQLKYALQSKFRNLFPMFLSSYTSKLKLFTKMLSSHQLTTSYVFYKMLTPSFNI